jgi:hypothetical protein
MEFFSVGVKLMSPVYVKLLLLVVRSNKVFFARAAGAIVLSVEMQLIKVELRGIQQANNRCSAGAPDIHSRSEYRSNYCFQKKTPSVPNSD